MSATEGSTLILGFPDYHDSARRLADCAGLACADVQVRSFPDGESLVRLPDSLPSRVILCCTLNEPNRRLIELELAAATALELGAERLTLVAPYLCYMRQDIAFHPGEAVSQRIIGRLLAHHFDTLITVDPHLHRTARLDDAIPVRRTVALSATPAMADWLAGNVENPLILGPDAESAQWVSAIAGPGGLEYGIARKRRLGDRDVRVELPDIDVGGRNVVLVDDVVSTGHTLAETARQVAAAGAASITALVTHALFVGDALQLLRDAGVGVVCSSDSVPHPSNGISLAKILAGALSED